MRWAIVILLTGCESVSPTAVGAGGGTGSSSSTTTGAGITCGEPESHAGEATFYDADGSGNCSFDPSPDDLMVAAMNEADYAGSAPCGACIRVEGPQGAVDVRVVDRCPGCAPGDVDLSPTAFERIAALSQGRVAVQWRYVECGITTPVVFKFKDGSNPWWSAVQVRNHRHAIAELAYQNADAWVDVDRLAYNYFVEPDGMGPGPYTFRVRDVMGNELIESNIAFAENAEVVGTSQFPACK